jgi:hypothetical protein
MLLQSIKLISNKNIDQRLKEHIKQGTAEPFDSELIDKIKNTNVFAVGNFYTIFEMGLNIGNCGLTARYLSFLFEDFILVQSGTCDLLKGTEGAPNGEHAWIIVGEFLYDTTLMLKIAKDVAYSSLGYIPDVEITSKELKKINSYNLEKEFAKNEASLKMKTRLLKEYEKISEQIL